MAVLDPTISYGALINAGVILTGIVSAFFAIKVTVTRLSGKIDLLDAKIENVKQDVSDMQAFNSRLSNIETRQATQGQMLATQDEDIRDMKHGRGFVSISGEYNRSGKVSA